MRGARSNGPLCKQRTDDDDDDDEVSGRQPCTRRVTKCLHVGVGLGPKAALQLHKDDVCVVFNYYF